MIASIETSAGHCMMQVDIKKDRSPCPDCLVSRLKEAGFTLNTSVGMHEEVKFPSILLEALRIEDKRFAPVVRLVEDEATIHTLLPVPNCPTCSHGQVRSSASPPLSSDILRDPLLGITSSLSVEDMSKDTELLCSTVTGRIHVPDANEVDNAYGQGLDVSATAESQLGETVERYTAFRPEWSRLITVPPKELQGQIPPLEYLNGFGSEQLSKLGYTPLKENQEMAWIEGNALKTGRPAFVPAASVFLRRSWNPDEPRYATLISHGLACHRSFEEARERALFEVYERYHLTVAWHRQEFGIFLNPSILPPEIYPILERLKRENLSLHIMCLTSPPELPVALAVIFGNKFPWVSLGSGANYFVSDAAVRAAVEACGGWQYKSNNLAPGSHTKRLPYLAGAGEHSLYYNSQKRSLRLQKVLLRGSNKVFSERKYSTNKSIVEQINSLAPHATEVCITTPDCGSCGFEVVKIVTPGLPIFQFGRVGTPHRNLTRSGLPPVNSVHPYP